MKKTRLQNEALRQAFQRYAEKELDTLRGELDQDEAFSQQVDSLYQRHRYWMDDMIHQRLRNRRGMGRRLAVLAASVMLIAGSLIAMQPWRDKKQVPLTPGESLVTEQIISSYTPEISPHPSISHWVSSTPTLEPSQTLTPQETWLVNATPSPEPAMFSLPINSIQFEVSSSPSPNPLDWQPQASDSLPALQLENRILMNLPGQIAPYHHDYSEEDSRTFSSFYKSDQGKQLVITIYFDLQSPMREGAGAYSHRLSETGFEVWVNQETQATTLAWERDGRRYSLTAQESLDFLLQAEKSFASLYQ